MLLKKYFPILHIKKFGVCVRSNLKTARSIVPQYSGMSSDGHNAGFNLFSGFGIRYILYIAPKKFQMLHDKI